MIPQHSTFFTAFVFLVSVSAPAKDVIEDTASSAAPEVAPAATVFEAIFGPDNAYERAYDNFQAWKEKTGIPISIGAHSWFHVDRDEFVYGDGYGVPNQRGTYYYYANFDPVVELPSSEFIDRVGVHYQHRFRDTGDKLRAFYSNTNWIYEAYAFADTQAGTFKAGKIATNFGLAWDNSWWEGVPYFDGYSFDPDYGISWDQVFTVSDTLSVAASAQFFFAEDGINGSLVGADPESVAGLNERNTGILRVVPTFTISDEVSLDWGLSGMAGEIENGSRFGVDDSRVAWGTDLSLHVGNWTIYGEYIDNHGAIHPTRYVSGGPSDRQNSARGGIKYEKGWFGARLNYSRGWDHNPDGDQWIISPGITLQLAKNLTLYAEYVNWEVTNSAGDVAIFDDGFELVLVWSF